MKPLSIVKAFLDASEAMAEDWLAGFRKAGVQESLGFTDAQVEDLERRFADHARFIEAKREELGL